MVLRTLVGFDEGVVLVVSFRKESSWYCLAKFVVGVRLEGYSLGFVRLGCSCRGKLVFFSGVRIVVFR